MLYLRNSKVMKKIFTEIKTWFMNLCKGLWNLNWEAKLGLILLIPPIIAAIHYLEGGFSTVASLRIYHNNIADIVDADTFFSAEPVFYGLLALAGAYLIKGNLKH